MLIRALRDALYDVVPWAHREHRGWWRSWDRSGRYDFDVRSQIDAALGAHDGLVDALAAALVADRGEAAALRAVDELWVAVGHADDAALCRAVRVRLSRPAPRLHQVVNGIDSPATALAVYLLSLQVIDGSRPAGFVWLEDLAEALLLPPTLIRQVRNGWARCETLRLAASA